EYEAAYSATHQFAIATDFAPIALELFQKLQHNFPQAAWDIEAEVMQELAFSNNKDKRIYVLKTLNSMIKQKLSNEQQNRLKKIVHDASCNAKNYEYHEEYFEWARIALALSETNDEKAISLRLMATSKLKLGDVDVAMQLAEEAVKKELSKKSLFAYFQVALQHPKAEKTMLWNIIAQLIELDDFDIYDLVTFAHASYEAGHQAIVLVVLENISQLLKTHIQHTKEVPKIPIGVLFQNMAQLSLSDPTLDKEASAANFVKYLNGLFDIIDIVCESQPEVIFGPPSIFEWFYGVCHNIACNNGYWEYYNIAASIALKAEEIFPNQTQLKGREVKCKLAIVYLQMKRFDTLSDKELHEILQCSEYCLSKISIDSNLKKFQDSIVTAIFKIKIRLNELDGNFVEKYSQGLERSTTKFRELGGMIPTIFDLDSNIKTDFVLLQARGIAREKSYDLWSIASSLYKMSLQIELQKASVESTSIIYTLKKIISLTKTKEDGYEWLSQARQISTSLSIALTDDDVEWFLAKAWNLGISCYRNHQAIQAKNLMLLALNTLDQAKSKLKMSSISTPNNAKELSHDEELDQRLSKCIKLTQGHDLNLVDLSLTNVPNNVMELSHLTKLNLRNNQLEHLPMDMVESLPHLEILNLAQNQLSTLPPNIGSLQKLSHLFAQSNRLLSLPISLMNCTKLRELYVQHNAIRELPDEYVHLTNLDVLSIAHNDIKSLSKAFNALSNLKVVDLSGNPLNEVPELLRRLHEKNLVLHSREKRRELITRAIKVKNSVADSLKKQAREVALGK
ncbi:hypothetical protein THRCLA_08763, partial [Thraustotheca clavata]